MESIYTEIGVKQDFLSAERVGLSDTMLGLPMQISRPNRVRCSDWLGYRLIFYYRFLKPSGSTIPEVGECELVENEKT